MSYGDRTIDYMQRVPLRRPNFEGGQPSELPVEQSTHFYLSINLKTAKVLGIIIAQSLLQRADEVIQ